MKKTIILSVLLISGTALFLGSCKKKKEVDNETQTVVDNAICEQQFMAIQPVVNEKGINQAGIKKVYSCETFSIIAGDTTDANADKVYDNGPVTFQIDYGTGSCTGADGITRTGKINITTAKKWSAYNNSVTVDLVGYKYGNVTFTGTVTISRPDSVTMTTQVINGHCTDGSWNIDYACTKTLKQLAGYSTPGDLTDDVFSVWGTSNGKNRNGVDFNTNIASGNPIIKKANCKWITSGVIEVTPSGYKTRTVDFGNGNCDDDATYTVDGQSFSFKLK